MLRIIEVSEVEHQALQHRLAEGVIDWAGFGDQIGRKTDALLGGPEKATEGQSGSDGR